MEVEEEEKLDLEEKSFKLNVNETSNIENLNIAYIPKITNLLEFIITQNNINKKYKFSLFKIRGFDPNTIFNEIDTISSGFINSKDLEEYLSNNNIKIETEILNLFIRQFNKEGKDKNLYQKDYINFINFGVPITEKTSSELNNYNKDEINKFFLNLMISEFELIKNQKKLINEIIQIKEFSTFEAFNIISSNKNYIDLNMLKQFLGNKFQDNEIKELIHRIDLNNDKKISYEEFQDLFFPFQSHLHLDSDKEKEIENFIQNKYYINSTLYENYILSSPNIIDKKDNILNEKEIKININRNTNDKIKDSNNEIDFEIKKDYKDEDLFIKYDESLIKELNEKNDFNSDNKENNDENYFSLKLKCENDKIKTSKIINDLSKHDNSNFEALNINKKEENKDTLLNCLSLNKNINLNENENEIISKSELILPNNNINTNIILTNKQIKLEFLTETDKDIIRSFIDYIQTLILLENKLETIKESISLCNDISLLDIFNIFNKDKDDLITKNNFIQICQNKFYIYPTEKQIKLVFDRYDLDNDDILNSNEFLKMISPLKKEYLIIGKEKDKNKNKKDIDFETKEKITELFKRIIENESLIYDLKMKLKSDKNFNFVFLWGIIMKFSQDGKKVDKNEFNNFLENFKCFLTNYELDVIFYKFAIGNKEIKYDSLFKDIITYDY